MSSLVALLGLLVAWLILTRPGQLGVLEFGWGGAGVAAAPGPLHFPLQQPGIHSLLTHLTQVADVGGALLAGLLLTSLSVWEVRPVALTLRL